MLGQPDFVASALVEHRLLTPEGLERAARHAREKNLSPTAAIAELELVDARTIALVRALVAECPFVELSDFDVNLGNARLLPRAVAEGVKAFPLFLCSGVATIAMTDPFDLRALDQVRAALGDAASEVDPVVCEARALGSLIQRAYALTARVEASNLASRSDDPELSTGREPIVAAVNQILTQGLELGASDIHVSPDEGELCLRFRVDGVLRRVQGPSLDAHAGIIQRLKVMANLDLTQTRRPQDGKFRFAYGRSEVDIRVSLVPTVNGENAVLRLLSSEASIRGFSELGLSTSDSSKIQAAIGRPHGMFLVTGPTGSGKTTTLYTAVKHLNSPDVNIFTIEDPVEIRMPLVRQVQVNPQIGLTFASALRSILRQDPDVVFVGEVRDEDTARISIQAALTGHLVLSSLHTNDAVGAIPRLHDLGCPWFAISAALGTVVAQRLVRRVCSHCACAYEPTPAMLARFNITQPETHQRGKGCSKCGGLGYRGRVGVYEVLDVTSEVRRVIDAGADPHEIKRLVHAERLAPMLADGLAKARLGLTTLDEVCLAAATLDAGFDSVQAGSGDGEGATESSGATEETSKPDSSKPDGSSKPGDPDVRFAA
ncbi:MAG: GspE/PulE family protein [Planctomycetota bacterium]|nr:GspE/PulE family protein [Planctomycetota bacterium]